MHRSPTMQTIIDIPEHVYQKDEITPKPMRFAAIAVVAVVIFIQVKITSQDSDIIRGPFRKLVV